MLLRLSYSSAIKQAKQCASRVHIVGLENALGVVEHPVCHCNLLHQRPLVQRQRPAGSATRRQKKFAGATARAALDKQLGDR